MQIETASLHCSQDKFFQLHAVEAHTLELDDRDFLWLSVDKPVECTAGANNSFDIVLSYHKGGLPFDLDILGDAKLVDGHQEPALPVKAAAAAGNGKLVLKVQIIDVDYWERKPPVFKSIVHKLRYMFSGKQVTSNKQLYADHQMSA